MKKNHVIGVILLILLIFLTVFFLFFNRDEKENQNRDVEQPLPDVFVLENERGEEVDIHEFIGKPMVLSFWVSWSEESLKQLQVMENVFKLVKKDVVFIAVHSLAFDTVKKEEVIEYLQERSYEFQTVIDEEGKVHKEYYIGKFPTTFFIDYNGKIVRQFTQLIEEDKILNP